MLLLLLTLTALAHAQTEEAPLQGVFVGFFGNQAVVAQFGGEGELRGRFYYRRDGLDIVLEGGLQGGKYVLGERYPDARRGILTLSWQRDDLNQRLLVGNHQLGQRSSLVLLRPVQRQDLIAALNAPLLEGWKRSDPYMFLKFDQPWQVGRLMRYGSIRLRWYTEPKSGVSLPRLEGRSPVNPTLADEHIRIAARALRCNAGAQTGWRQATTLSWITRTNLSLRSVATTRCEAGGSDSFPASMTFDLRSGKKLALEDFYRPTWVPRGYDPAKSEEFNFANFSEYLDRRKRVLTVRALLWNRSTRLNPHCWGEESGLEPTDVLSADSWYLGRGGLTVQLDFPQGLNECDLELTIPYAGLR
ncbi:MAG: hypothetical protein SFU83_05455 [Meiothermus sp.]|nr:hypothetical protein [Meiothermus sp.]